MGHDLSPLHSDEGPLGVLDVDVGEDGEAHLTGVGQWVAALRYRWRVNVCRKKKRKRIILRLDWRACVSGGYIHARIRAVARPSVPSERTRGKWQETRRKRGLQKDLRALMKGSVVLRMMDEYRYGRYVNFNGFCRIYSFYMAYLKGTVKIK